MMLAMSAAKAQSGGHFLYLEIRGLSQQRGVPELKSQLQSIPAIDSVVYCENNGLVIVHTTTPASVSRRAVYNLLKNLNYHFYIKNDIPAEEAERICYRQNHH